MAKVYDVVAVVGKYQKDGQDKLKYRNVGVVIQGEKGLRLKLESPVTLDDEGKVVQWFGLYEPSAEKSPQQNTQSGFVDDEIPF